MANLPTRTTASTAAEHVGDHNNLHTFHNLIDAAGDLIVGTGVDTAGRLAKGSALQGLRVNAAGTALEYGADAASSVVFTPAAGIAATNVQAAIEEVVSDSSAAYHPITARSAKATRTAALSIVTATVTAIGLDTESWDTDTLHDNVTNNTRIVLNRVGKWAVVGQISYAGNATGTRQCRIHVNGTYTGFNGQPASAAGNTLQAVAVVNATAVTDYVELCAYQDCGVNLALSGLANAENFLSAVFLGA